MIVGSILDLSGLNSLMVRKMLSDLPKDIKEYIERIKSSERKKQSLGAYTLLKYLHSTFFKNEMPKKLKSQMS